MTGVEILSGKRVRSGDTEPTLRAVLLDEYDNNFNLDGYTVNVVVKEAGTDTAAVDTAATITESGAGIVEYEWQSGDTDTPGAYLVEFNADDGGGSTISFPSGEYAIIVITEAV